MLEPLPLLCDGGVFVLHGGEPLVGNESDAVADVRQPLVGVILPVEQTVFAARRHNTVRLFRSFCNEIVDERTDVAVRTAQDQRLLAADLERGVHARDESLHGGFLVAGRAVELARAVQTGDLFALERGAQLRGIDAVVLDGIGAALHLGVFQSRNGADNIDLHVLRQRGRQTLNVQLLRMQTHRLNEELVAFLIRKRDDLRLNRGAVARAGAFNGAVEERTAVKIGADDLVRARFGIGKPAHGAVMQRRSVGGIGKRLDLLIAGLELHFVKADAARVHARRRAGLEAAETKTHIGEALRELRRRGEPVRAGGAYHVADDRPPAEICPRSDDNSAHRVYGARVCRDGGNMAVRKADGNDLRLMQHEIFLRLQRLLHDLLIAPPVGLYAQGVDGGAFAAVEHPELNARSVRRLAHLAAEHIKLADEMPLARAADGGVARHVADAVEIHREAHGAQPEPRRGERGLDARVTGADNGNIKFSGVVGFHAFLSAISFKIARMSVSQPYTVSSTSVSRVE